MANLFFDKKLGQHILTNTAIIESIINRSKIKPTDIILEIGPGTGSLTIPMLKKAKKVICIEMDPRLASELLKKAKHMKLDKKLELLIGDALKIDFPHFDMCISNTPYQISSPLIFKLMDYNFKCAFLMFQREFAERLVARPGNSQYCRLSVAVQLRLQVDHVLKVSKGSFLPPPKVESSVVRLEPKKKIDLDLKDFNKLLKICFLRKNKTLSAIFKGNGVKCLLKCNNEDELEELLQSKGFGLRRANKMDIEDFLELLLELKKINIAFK